VELSTDSIGCRVIFGLHDLGIVTRALACLAYYLRLMVSMCASTRTLSLFDAHTCLVSCNAGDTKLAGASAGSLIAACYHSGLPEDLITKACFTLAKGEPACMAALPPSAPQSSAMIQVLTCTSVCRLPGEWHTRPPWQRACQLSRGAAARRHP
jgi:hypothetical protein